MLTKGQILQKRTAFRGKVDISTKVVDANDQYALVIEYTVSGSTNVPIYTAIDQQRNLNVDVLYHYNEENPKSFAARYGLSHR